LELDLKELSINRDGVKITRFSVSCWISSDIDQSHGHIVAIPEKWISGALSLPKTSYKRISAYPGDVLARIGIPKFSETCAIGSKKKPWKGDLRDTSAHLSLR